MLHFQPHARRAILIPLVPTLFLLPMSLDFRSAEAGGTVWQYLVTASVAAGWLLYFANGRFLKPRGTLWEACHWAILLTIAGSVISLTVNRTPFGDYARVFISIALFGMAFFFGARMAHAGRTETMNRLIDIGCLISIVFTVFAGFMVSGQGIGEIRYQILSPVLLPFEAILLHKILVAKTNPRQNTLLLAACLALQLLSVTRSALLAFAIVLAAALWVSSPTLLRFLRRGIRIAVPGALAVSLAVGASAVVSRDVVTRWQERVFTVEKFGVDPTTISRLAEIKEQIDRWKSGPVSILVGQGFGASYGWSKDFYDALLDTGAFQIDRIDQPRAYFGHNYWVSSLFSGGILFGVAIPLVLLLATVAGLRTARRMLRLQIDVPTRLEISRAALVLTAALAITIGGNPFLYRYTPLIAGLSLGVLVVMRSRIRGQRAQNAVPATWARPHWVR